jgi:hypothetical protein
MVNGGLRLHPAMVLVCMQDEHNLMAEPEDWQLEEIGKAIEELDSDLAVSHARVSKWLRLWGKPGEGKVRSDLPLAQ